jgi:hypothetical protein
MAQISSYVRIARTTCIARRERFRSRREETGWRGARRAIRNDDDVTCDEGRFRDKA